MAAPTFTHLQEALQKAKAQCQVHPVEDRIASSKKRIVSCQAEVSQAQEALAKAHSKLQ